MELKNKKLIIFILTINILKSVQCSEFKHFFPGEFSNENEYFDKLSVVFPEYQPNENYDNHEGLTNSLLIK